MFTDKVIRPEMKVFQVIPDRTVDNKKSYNFARDLHDIYCSWFKRIQEARKTKALYKTKERFWWIIRMTNKDVKFHFACSTASNTYINQKIDRFWSKVTKKDNNLEDIQVPTDNTLLCEMKYRRHNIFSLSADWREDHTPIASIINIVRDLKDGDVAGIWICLEPVSRIGWSDIAEKAHETFKQGKTPNRRNLTGRFSLMNVGRGIDVLMHEVSDFTDLVMEDQQKKKKKDDHEKREILIDGQLDSMTRSKRHTPTFKTFIRCVSHSLNPDRRQINLRALSNAFNELSGDNELIRQDINRKIQPKYIKEINSLDLSLLSIADFDANIMSADEVGKFIQLPTASLQDQYAEYLDIVEHREADLPERLLNGGMRLGTISVRGQTKDIYFPITNEDELCLGRVIIGGMGSGKTKGYGANLAVEAVKNGFGALVIDPAKHEMGDEIEKALPPDKIIRINIAKQKISLDWCETKHAPFAKDLLVASMQSFFDTNMDETGGQTSRYLTALVMAMQTNKLTEILELMEDENYLKSCMDKMPNNFNKKTLNLYLEESDNRKRQLLAPIYNRLNIIMGSTFLMSCFESDNSLDFVELLCQKKVIVLDIAKKDGLSASQIDIIANLITTKISLAMQLRPESKQHPFFIIYDEPHQFLKSAAYWEFLATESRKWRVSFTWMFHDWIQLPRNLREIIKSALPHYHFYTSKKGLYSEFAEELSPFTVEECLKTPRFHAINILRSGGITLPVFMAKMTPPPSKS